jgi:hypothetical protein
VIFISGHAGRGADLPLTSEAPTSKASFFFLNCKSRHSLLTTTFSLQRTFKSDIMVLQTPYVTPHILHKNYAQAHDAEVFGNSKLIPSRVRLVKWR